MDKHCDHNIPETRKGVGPCNIVAEIRKRNGQPHWWCKTHGLEASAPDGAALTSCSGSWYDAVDESATLQIDVARGHIGIWGAVPPTIVCGTIPQEGGGVHVHRRSDASGSKDIDGMFEIVQLVGPSGELAIETMGSRAFAVSQFTGQQPVRLECPKCGDAHIDELMFATRPHKKHQCNLCGRPFFDPEGPSVSNPFAGAHKQLGIPDAPDPEPAEASLVIDSTSYSGVAIWPSNRAIVWTMAAPERVGIHVHAWDSEGRRVVDETYAQVVLDGVEIDRSALSWLAAQKEIAQGAPVVRLSCQECDEPLLSPTTDWITPVTAHECRSCGSTTRTRLRSFVNPLA